MLFYNSNYLGPTDTDLSLLAASFEGLPLYLKILCNKILIEMSGNPVFSGAYVKQQTRKLLITFESGYYLRTMGKFERPVELCGRVHVHFFGGGRSEP